MLDTSPLILLSVVVLLLAGAPCFAQTSGSAGPRPPTNLRCEYRTDPLGIDARDPRLSWEGDDPRRGARQTAYQVLVATDAADLAQDRGTAWDSGQVASDESVHVEYHGQPLRSGVRYFWKVRTWDQNGQASAYAAPAWWEMGLLRPEDWTAQWIGTAGAGDEGAPEPKCWVWHDRPQEEPHAAHFRGVVTVRDGSPLKRALAVIGAAGGFHLLVNGRSTLARGARDSLVPADLTTALIPGRNTVAIRAAGSGAKAGLLFALALTYDDGAREVVHADAGWRVSATPADGWESGGFDDRAWQPAVVRAAYGAPPWGRPAVEPGARRSQCLRREIVLRAAPRAARVYATGLGLYELSINGQRVGDGELQPEWTDYFRRVPYQTYDATALLREGRNALGMVLGNGWWAGELGGDVGFQYSAGPLRGLVQLEVEYADGTRERFVSDAQWRTHSSPVVADSLYNGELYDARLETPGWDRPGFDDGGWKPAVVVEGPHPALVAAACAPIRVMRELPAALVTEPRPGVHVYDFGQNQAGKVRLKVSGSPGARIRIRFAEVLNPDGTIYVDNYRTARATDVYICRGDGAEVWRPRFTYRGFRYAELTGHPGTPPADALVALTMYSDVPEAGVFRCGNDVINRTWASALWTQRSNLYSVPTDCPQRDERLGWLGDAQIFGPTACWNMDMAAFFEKWLRDIRDAQDEQGAVRDVAPAAVVKTPAAPGWGDACIVVPWTVYRFYGDRRIIADNYDCMVRWVEYMRRNAPGDLYEREGYGDWVPVVPSPSKTIGAAYYYHSTKLLAQMAAIIGRDEDAQQYGALAERIAAAFHRAYYNADTHWYLGDTQTANVLPLFMGITPAESRAAVLENVIRDIGARGDHVSTGFIGTGCLMPLLAGAGEQELAYRLATQRTYPAWGCMLEYGATTIWERWNSDMLADPSMNSRNHYAFGAVAQWFYESLAGIAPDAAQPGFKRMLIRPQPPRDLPWAWAEHHCPYGLVRAGWHREGRRLVLDVRVPPNASAQVCVPTLGAAAATIREGGVVLLRGGREEGQVEGLRFERLEESHAVFDAAAGRYRFAVEPPEAP